MKLSFFSNKDYCKNTLSFKPSKYTVYREDCISRREIFRIKNLV